MIPECNNCTKCELHKTRIKVVIGKGNPKADILFIGEAPGRNEDLQGKPFVGAAGKNLDKMLQVINLTSEDIYIANILKCRPPKNRNPSIDEIKTCTPWLIEQIKTLNPKIICTLGNYSTKFILAKCDPEGMKKIPGITELHGQLKKIEFDGQEYNVMPLFHPAAIIYRRHLMPLWNEDMIKVKDFVEKALNKKLE